MHRRLASRRVSVADAATIIHSMTNSDSVSCSQGSVVSASGVLRALCLRGWRVLALSLASCYPSVPPRGGPAPSVSAAVARHATCAADVSYTVQCSGWFPDWIARSEPPEGATAFRLAQGYPLGEPLLAEAVDGIHVSGWAPPAASAAAPLLAYDIEDESQRLPYLDALKTYVLKDLAAYDFVPQNATAGMLHWYHVPMLTSGMLPREPRRGLTHEGVLGSRDAAWLAVDAATFGITLYNELGGYTIGQVFNSPEPGGSEPEALQFVDGTVMVHLQFVEYDSAKVSGSDPLAYSPEWLIQDPMAGSDETFAVRLLRADIAMKDPRVSRLGWVVATYVHDDSLVTSWPTGRWYSLRPVSLRWSRDRDDALWVNPAAVEASKTDRRTALATRAYDTLGELQRAMANAMTFGHENPCRRFIPQEVLSEEVEYDLSVLLTTGRAQAARELPLVRPEFAAAQRRSSADETLELGMPSWRELGMPLLECRVTERAERRGAPHSTYDGGSHATAKASSRRREVSQ